MRRIAIIMLALMFASHMYSQERTEVLTLIERVNDVWQKGHKAECRGFWDNAAYFTGNMAVLELIPKQEYVDYAYRWAQFNRWQGAQETDKSKWEYKAYGEDHRHVLFADWQICFQVYIDLYQLGRHTSPSTDYNLCIERAKEVMNYQTETKDNDYWWWADALYMGMPIFTKLYNVTKDERLLDKQYECFKWTDDLLFDKDVHLYYRDGKYIWPKVKTACDGGKSFWARGDGWVLAGLAKVLKDLPKDSKYRKTYEERFRQLAKAVADCQQERGYWSRSMLCEADAPGYETSGTAFFTYGLIWGVNNGLLKKKDFSETIEKAWKYLTETALQADGTIGYVQPIGEKPDPTRTVDARSQAPFGTGAWLLAACERYRYLER